jgi:phosphoribosylformylglycinamidine cyclo-ligase
MSKERLTYQKTGVDYDVLDVFKRLAQEAGRRTNKNIHLLDFKPMEWSRGESAFLIRLGRAYLAHVQEGLGTKNLVADAMYTLTKKKRSYYDLIAQDTAAMIINDIITVGAWPLSLAMHLSVGDSNWLTDELRYRDLLQGWETACHLSGCVAGPGETPTLKDIVNPLTCEFRSV